jgi:hypothetical protein
MGPRRYSDNEQNEEGGDYPLLYAIALGCAVHSVTPRQINDDGAGCEEREAGNQDQMPDVARSAA